MITSFSLRMWIVILATVFASLKVFGAGDSSVDAAEAEEKIFATRAATCLFPPQSGAPAGTDEKMRSECEKNLRAQIKSELAQAQIKRLRANVCDPNCSDQVRKQTQASLKALCQVSCQAQLPPELHAHIRSCDEEASCRTNPSDVAKRTLSAANVCGRAFFQGDAAQTKAFQDQVMGLPAKIIAAPAQVLSGLSRTAISVAQKGAHQSLLELHAGTHEELSNLKDRAQKTVQRVQDLAGPIYECLPPEKAVELACYVGGVGASATAAALVTKKAGSSLLALEQPQLLLQNAIALMNERATPLMVNARIGVISRADDPARAMRLLASGRENPQLEVWKLRDQGRHQDADALEKLLQSELSMPMLVKDVGAPDAGRTGARFVRFPGGFEGVWKPWNDSEFANGAAEIAVYRIDRHLGLNQVPVTVEQTFDGKRGTVQLRVKDLDEKAELGKAPKHLQLLDYLTGNWDRNSKNHLRTQSGRPVAIDHGLAFSYNTPQGRMPRLIREAVTKFEKQANLLKENPSAENEQSLKLARQNALNETREVFGSKKVYEKLKATPPEEWNRIIGTDEIASEKIEILRERQKNLIELVESARKSLGDDVFASP